MNRPSLQGSVFWMAPEVVKQTAHTSAADIWSVGCLVVEMLTGEHPWAQLTQMQAIFKVGGFFLGRSCSYGHFYRSVNLLNLLYHQIFLQRLRSSLRRLLISIIQLVQALVSCFSTLGSPSRSTQDFRARMRLSSLFQLLRSRHNISTSTCLFLSLCWDIYLMLLALPYSHACTLLQLHICCTDGYTLG